VLWDDDACRPAYDWENPHVTPDGRFLGYAAYDSELKASDICVLELGVDDAKPTLFLNAPADELAPRFHPSGRYMAYQSTESGIEEIYITSFPGAKGKWQVSVGGGLWPRFSADGGRLYYRQQNDVMVVDIDTDPTIRLGRPAKLFTAESSGQDIGQGRPEGLAVSADDRLLFVRRVQRDREARAASGITLVENWFAEFRDSR
jgi:Tol biopolymer transport system component